MSDNTKTLSPEELELIQKAQSGDEEAFTKLYMSYIDTIYYYSSRYIRNQEDVKDASQEIVLAMYHSIGALRDPNSFLYWLHRIIRNVSIDYVRKQRRHRDNTHKERIDDLADSLADDRQPYDLWTTVAQNEDNNQVLKAIDALPMRQRDALTLRYYDDLSYKDIAHVMRCSTGCVSTNIVYAKKNLKKILNKEILYK
ncbi:MAG: RNA polymerase sigma factor [Clostridiales Family XIII bacterium]|jgi:RNA polymerase sigma-70 factor (ECF subfamily)|nr:RNA polymerase sigma factor [Clostridiales Family XIII bacterium]